MTHARPRLVSGRLCAPVFVAIAGFLVFLGIGSSAAGQQCPNPASFIDIADPGTRYSSEGGSVSVPIVAVHSDPLVTLTWSAPDLPPDLQIDPTTGVISGTLAVGSAGSYSVRVTVTGSDGSGNCRNFTWKVSEWLDGDLFAGYGDYVGTYAWWSRDGQQLKGTFLVAPGEISAGCASDWRTGDLFTTDFASGTYRVSGAPGHTAEFFDSDRPAGSGEHRDTAPESVALANNGAFYVGHADGFYATQIDPNSGNPVDPCIGVPDCVPADATGSPLVRGFVLEGSTWTSDESYVLPALDGSNNPIPGVPGALVLDIDNQTLRYSSTAIGHYFVQVTGTQPEIVTPLKVDSGGNISAGGPGEYVVAGSRDPNGLPYWHQDLPGFYSASIPIHKIPGTQLRPFYERTPGQPVLGSGGALIPARLQDGRDLHVYRSDGSGGYVRTVYDTFVNTKGTDWIDLSSDQRTIFYTSEYGIVHRYDTETGTQLPPFAIAPESSLFALRLLPPGDGTGGLLVAALRHVVRLNGAGRSVMTYQGRATCDGDSNGCPDPQHFAVAIDPDGHRFWTGSYSTGNMYEFDIQNSHVLAGPVTNATVLAGLCAKREYTAAQEICNDTPLIDDDGDGIVNENCAPLEICSYNLSPGDDDGDGLFDVSDPDCGSSGAPPEACGDGIDNNNDGRIDEGVCPRQTAEGQPVAGVFLLPSYSASPDRTFAPNAQFPLPPGLSLNAQTGEITGTPLCTAVTRQEGTKTFPVRITMTDPGGSSSATFGWTVTHVNCAPVAVDDPDYSTNEDVTLPIAAVAGVLGNDTDVDGDALSAIVATGSGHGILTLNANGSFTYTPDANYNGPDSFTYTAGDGYGGTSTATVTITVAAVNDAPVAVNDAFTTNEDTVLTVPAPGVAGNDTDVEGNALTAALVSGPSHSTLTLSSDGSFIYTPDANYHGPDSFTYRANDGSANSDLATVTITITPVNDPPVANSDTASTLEGTPVTFAVLGNDTDVDNATLSISSFAQPAHGSVTLNADGTFTYMPTAGYIGGDSFDYTVKDPDGLTSTATVSLSVNPANRAPVAAPDSYTTNEDTALTIAAPGVLANDSDADGDALTVVLVSGPGHGTLTLNANGSFYYVPASNDFGTDTFTYQANDGKASSTVATVTIIVNSVNDTPVAQPGTATTPEDTPVSGMLQATDADGDPLTYALLTAPPSREGEVVVNLNGTYTFTPNLNFFGTTSFTYTASDGHGGTARAVVTVVVTPVNDAPVCSTAKANPSQIWPPNHKFVPISIRGVTDPDGNPVTIKVTSISQDEPTNTDGDGSHTPDGKGVGTSKASVRAERSGTKKTPGNGRVYHIDFTATDGKGGTCAGEVLVCVPHDQGGRSTCIDGGPLYDSTGVSPPRGSHDENHCDDERHDHRKPKTDKGSDDGRGKKK